MSPLVWGLLAAAFIAGVYAATIWQKAHLDPRMRHEIAFVLALSTTAVCSGIALLVATVGGHS